ncbi:MAG: hypothetical protein AAFX87_27000 [Bacteroidota bacterium]
MRKTIFLRSNNLKTIFATRTLFIATAAFFVTFGILELTGKSNQAILMTLSVPIIAIGALYFILSFILLSQNPKRAQRVAFDEEGIVYKFDLFRPITNLNWDKIKVIELDHHRINFILGKEKKSLFYSAPQEVSTDIKNTIRQFAYHKNIEVIGR